MSVRLALLMGAALLCGGCEIPADVGKPCVLVKRDTTDPKKSAPVVLADIQRDQDFISFGSLDCEDLLCVRNAGSPIQTTGEGTEQRVLGYCSKPCSSGAITDTCAVNHPEASAEITAGMSCRALLLDQQALNDLKVNSPAEYANTFGNNDASPFFCAAQAVTTP